VARVAWVVELIRWPEYSEWLGWTGWPEKVARVAICGQGSWSG
jgi:hypothetical protein